MSLDFSHLQARIQKPTTKANSERASLLEPFITRLNNSRVEAGYKPLGAGFYASKMTHHKTEDLEGYYKDLNSSRNFCALWWWQNVPKKKG